MGCGVLATKLDELMLHTKIAHFTTPDECLPIKPGAEVAKELGGRMLLRYVDRPDENGRTTPTYTTPTPYSTDEVVSFLALPAPLSPRRWVVVIDPSEVERIKGPRYCVMGLGIEYILPDGYPSSSLTKPGWALEVR